jgi:hypothetical protein
MSTGHVVELDEGTNMAMVHYRVRLFPGSVCAGDGQSRRQLDTGVRQGPSPIWVGVVPNYPLGMTGTVGGQLLSPGVRAYGLHQGVLTLHFLAPQTPI